MAGEPPTSPADRAPLNYRRLEESRDKYQAEAERWFKKALAGLPAEVGLDPRSGNTRLLLSAFERDHGMADLDPELAVEQFRRYAEEQGMLEAPEPAPDELD